MSRSFPYGNQARSWGRDIMANEGRLVRGSKAMEGVEGPKEELVWLQDCTGNPWRHHVV